MRITNTMLVSLLLHNLNRSRERLIRHQIQLSTGKRLTRPSDDPSGTFRSLKYRSNLRDIDRYQANIDNSVSWLSMTDSVLNDISDALVKARGLAMRGASGSTGEPERSALAHQVDQLLQHLLDLANTQFEGKYIFGGTETLTPPYSPSDQATDEQFTAAYDQPVDLGGTKIVEGSVVVTEVGGGRTFVERTDYLIDYEKGTITVLNGGSMLDGVVYEIDYRTEWVHTVHQNSSGVSGEILRQIGDGLTIPLNIPGGEVFNGEVALFDVLLALRDNLIRGNTSGISQALENLERALDQTLKATATVGSRLQRLDLAKGRLKDRVFQTTATLSEVEDADVAEAMVNLHMEENALEAALKTGARLIQLTLVDFLK